MSIVTIPLRRENSKSNLRNRRSIDSNCDISDHDMTTTDDDDDFWMEIVNTFAMPEGLSTVCLLVVSCLFRGLLDVLIFLASRQEECQGSGSSSSSLVVEVCRSRGMFGRGVAEIAGLILSFLPGKISRGMAPGFIFASTWILFPLRDKFGPVPSLPTRISEMVLGRLTPRDLGIIIPVHFLASLLAAGLIRLVLPIQLVSPVVYSEDSLWLVDFTREILVNAAFSVSVLAGTEILKLNRIPRVFLVLFLLPLYLYGVDADGRASTFGPNVLYALRCVTVKDEVPIRQSSHFLGPLIGGALGGKIMVLFFPDDPRY